MEQPIIFTKEAQEGLEAYHISQDTAIDVIITGEHKDIRLPAEIFRRYVKGDIKVAQKFSAGDEISIVYRLKHTGKLTVLGGVRDKQKAATKV